MIIRFYYKFKVFSNNAYIPLIFLFFSGLLFASCGSGDKITEIELPEVPVITGIPKWGVVSKVYAPVMKISSHEAVIITHLRRGAVVNIIKRTEYQEKIDFNNNYWYRINIDDIDGWVFGDYLLLYGTREKALNASKEIRQ
jgi:hypothetical protein